MKRLGFTLATFAIGLIERSGVGMRLRGHRRGDQGSGGTLSLQGAMRSAEQVRAPRATASDPL